MSDWEAPAWRRRVWRPPTAPRSGSPTSVRERAGGRSWRLSAATSRTFLGGHPEQLSRRGGAGHRVARCPRRCAAARVGARTRHRNQHRDRVRVVPPAAGRAGGGDRFQRQEHGDRADGTDAGRSGPVDVAGGNLGTPASQLVLDGGWESWVLEVSSFQAELLTAMAPQAAVFLNLSQDHLERHPDLDSTSPPSNDSSPFRARADTAVLNADDPMVGGDREPRPANASSRSRSRRTRASKATSWCSMASRSCRSSEDAFERDPQRRQCSGCSTCSSALGATDRRHGLGAGHFRGSRASPPDRPHRGWRALGRRFQGHQRRRHPGGAARLSATVRCI